MNQQKRQRLLSSLESVLDEWLSRNAESDLAIGYYGDSTQYLMAVAALAVLEAVDDVHETLNKDGMLADKD